MPKASRVARGNSSKEREVQRAGAGDIAKSGETVEPRESGTKECLPKFIVGLYCLAICGCHRANGSWRSVGKRIKTID